MNSSLLRKFLIQQAWRSFSTSNIHQSEIKAMKKILKGNLSKRKQKYVENTPPLPTPNALSKGAFEGRKSVNWKRTAALNKLFMRYITDLMATGENAHVFTGHGIEISRVEITPDFRMVQVYWLTKGNNSDDALIDKILMENSYALRHELSQLRVVGEVPKIRFVKDKQMAQIMEVDFRLAQADFGDDFKPSEASAKLKSELKLQIKLTPDLKERIENLPNEDVKEEEEEELPDMVQNVLGLNHLDILERVQKGLKRPTNNSNLFENDLQLIDDLSSEDLPRNLEKNSFDTFNRNPVEFSSQKDQKAAFKEFLVKRTIMLKKMQKTEKNDRLELEYLQEELEKTREKEINFKFEQFVKEDNNDYIEEDDLEKTK